jgi:hypothetical protein
MIYYWTLHTLQHTALCFGNNWTSSASVYIICCVYKQKMWLTVLIWKSLKITVFYKSSL